MTKEIYVFSNLGADKRVFQRLDFSGLSKTFIKWIFPQDQLKIEIYTTQILNQISTTKPTLIDPSIICFLEQNGKDEPKIFIRTLLYATADQGQYIQNMFVKICRAETTQNFNVWGYGDNGLVRGSGLFANKTGVSVYHHFLLPKSVQWNFCEGDYRLEVYSETVDNSTKKLFEQKLTLTTELTQRN